MSGATIVISIARQEDVETLLALVADLLDELGEEGREFAAIDMVRLDSELRSGLASERFFALLAWEPDGRPLGPVDDRIRDQAEGTTRRRAVGVLTLCEGFAIYAGGRYGIIDEMYVCPAHRGEGIGRALLERAVSLASDRGWPRLEVTAPEDDAGGAADFYERGGFRFSGNKLHLLL